MKSGDWFAASQTSDAALDVCAAAPNGVTIVAGDSAGRVHFLRLEGLEQIPG